MTPDTHKNTRSACRPAADQQAIAVRHAYQQGTLDGAAEMLCIMMRTGHISYEAKIALIEEYLEEAGLELVAAICQEKHAKCSGRFA